MMNTKTQRNLSIIATVAILILAILAVVMFQNASAPSAYAAEGDAIYGEYDGDQGSVEGGHRTRGQIAQEHGVDVSSVVAITTGEDLYKFLNGDSKYSVNQVAYLANDVGISYNVYMGTNYFNA